MNRTGISSIEIENFKGIGKPVSVELRPITLLFGPNSAGKSTILHALLYALEILENRSPDADRTAGGGSLDLGGFQTFVYQHDVTRNIRIRITLRPDDDGLPIFESPGELTYEDEESSESSEALLRFDVNSFADIKTVWTELIISWNPQTRKPWITSYATGANDIEVGRIELFDHPGRGVLPSLVSFNTEHPIFAKLESDERETLFYPFDSLAQWIPPVRYSQSAIPSFEHWLGDDSEMAQDPGSYDFWSLASQLIVGPGKLLANELQRLRYIGPIRELPERVYNPPISEEAGRWAEGLAAWDTLFREPDVLTPSYAGGGNDLKSASSTLIDEVSQWLSGEDRLNTGYSLAVVPSRSITEDSSIWASIRLLATQYEERDSDFVVNNIITPLESIRPVNQIILRDEYKGLEVSLQDIGIGISQVIPIVVGAICPGFNLMSAEQPELHVHPAIQCDLADLFISRINLDEEKTFLLETHSEHLVLRLLRRIRETTDNELVSKEFALTPDKIAIYYVEQTDEGSQITRIPVDSDGEFTQPWPKGFFEERIDELM